MFAIDLTCREVTISYRPKKDVKLRSFPWTATFRKGDDSIIASVGEKDIRSDERTAFFHDLMDSFHLIQDRHVQIDIIAQLAREVAKILGKEMVSKDPTTFVVIPYGYSYEIFDVIKEGFLISESGLKLSGLFNELVASLIYFLETGYRRKILAPHPGDTLYFVNSNSSPPMVLVVEYQETDKKCALFISDYYAYNAQKPKFEPNQKIFNFGRSESVNLEGNGVEIVHLPNGNRVMANGAMILGDGKFNFMDAYTIDAAFGYGIQIDDKSFYHIIPSNLTISKPKMPLTQSKAFTISGINRSVNLNLYCGFSDSLARAIKLGTVTLTGDQRQHKDTDVVVSITLESIRSGSFSVLRLSKDGNIKNADPVVKDFNVPGWLG